MTNSKMSINLSACNSDLVLFVLRLSSNEHHTNKEFKVGHGAKKDDQIRSQLLCSLSKGEDS